jgi:hypothetical protein
VNTTPAAEKPLLDEKEEARRLRELAEALEQHALLKDMFGDNEAVKFQLEVQVSVAHRDAGGFQTSGFHRLPLTQQVIAALTAATTLQWGSICALMFARSHERVRAARESLA